MPGLLLACRTVVAMVFIVAAAGKIADFDGTRRAVRAFGASDRAVRLAPALPLCELTVGLALLLRPSAVAGAVGALLLLAVFCGAIVRAMARGEAPDCHCFGQWQSAPIGPATLVRNLLIAVPAALVLAGGRELSYPGALGHLDAGQIALVVVAVLAALLAVFCARLLSERRTLRAELVQARSAKPAPGLPRGTPAPGLTLTPLTGDTGSLPELWRGRTHTILVFVSTSCAPCRELLPRLAEWQESLSDLQIVAIFNGPEGVAEDMASALELPVALHQAGMSVSTAYNLRSTPAAIAVDSDGIIASAPAIGAPAIEALIRVRLSPEFAAGRPSPPAVPPARVR